MNKEQKKKGEKIATNILRVLAVIGFVAIVALATWLFVQVVAGAPSVRENLRAAVTTVTSIFEKAPEESLTFNDTTSTFGVNEANTISWKYEGEDTPDTYNLSYACGSNVKVSMFLDSGWTDISCKELVLLENPNVTIIAKNEDTRLANVMFTVEANNLSDMMLFSVVNTDISGTNGNTDNTASTEDTTTDEDTTDTTTNTETQNNEYTTQTPVNRTATRQVVVPQRVSVYDGPADLVVDIEETGVIVDVDDEGTFFPVSPIPSDKVAGVVFTVTNKGGETSEPWRFTAELPIEGDDDYEYTSPLQIPLATGMQITFTLGFDEVLEDSEGTIYIELDPKDSRDKKSNNTDSVTIEIDD